jgi:CheY-like chemotaxis protein
MKILIVDDELDVLKAIKAMMAPHGMEVLAISDSREAAQRVNTDKFDGVFLDVNMPNVDGFALTRSVRASRANAKTPIVMLTGLNDVATMRTGFKAGVTFFLSKPVNLERLNALIKVMRGPMLKERRRYARLPFRVPVTFQLGAKQFKTASINISGGGMLLEASGGASLGQELTVEFAIPPSARSSKVRTKVVRKDALDSIGLEFVGLEPQDRQAIHEFIVGQIKG